MYQRMRFDQMPPQHQAQSAGRGASVVGWAAVVVLAFGCTSPYPDAPPIPPPDKAALADPSVADNRSVKVETGPAITAFRSANLMGRCGEVLTLVGEAVQSDWATQPPSYALKAADGATVRVEAGAPGLPSVGTKLAVTGTVGCAFVMLVGGDCTVFVALQEESRKPAPATPTR